MKKYFINIVLLLFLQFGFSQIVEVTHLSNGTDLQLPVESIDSVNVVNYNSATLKRVYQNNGDILSIAVEDIDSITFLMPNVNNLPSLSTVPVTNDSPTSLLSGGIITSEGGSPITQRGVCWNTMPNPTIANNFTIDGTGTGSFISDLYPLNPSTVYYIRAYATNDNGTNYGNQISFTTSNPDQSADLPEVITGELIYNDGLTALGSGSVSINSGTITSRGLCWAIGATPTINSIHSLEGSGTGVFSSSLYDLQPDTLYRVRAFASSDAGIAYGEEVLFRTHDLPSQFETTLYNYLENGTVGLDMGVLYNGGSDITERGVCWSTEGVPTIESDMLALGTGEGVFNKTITNLNSNEVYSFRVYATNGIGTSYGPLITASLDGSLSLDDIYYLLYESGTRHYDFGQKGVDIFTDILCGDMALSQTAYGWYNRTSNYDDTIGEVSSSDNPPALIYDYYFRVINNANTIIQSLAPSGSLPTNQEDQWVLGQVLALRGYAYFYLTQLYQEQYNPSEIILPLHVGSQYDVNPVPIGDIYNQMLSDFSTAINLLDNYTRPNKLHIDKTVAQGLLAYVYASMGDYLNAKILADTVIGNGTPLTNAAELTYPGAGSGFNDVNTSSWLWGKDLSIDDGIQLIQWWGHIDYFTYGYAWAGDRKSIDDLLYSQISDDDIRKNQFGTGGTALQPINKFFDLSRTAGGIVQEITNDLIFMRSDEFYLLSAECAARLGDDSSARTIMVNLLNDRISGANQIVNSLSGQTLIDFIYLQTRIELWGEGKSYLAMKRNDATVTRGTNHVFRAGETFAHDMDELTFDINFENISTYSPPQLEFLNCEGVVDNGNELIYGEAVTNFTFQIPYTTQAGGNYEAMSIQSDGVEGLTASIESGVFDELQGVLEFTITGIPSSYGTAEFAVSIDGKDCNISFEVVLVGNCSAYQTILTINFNDAPEETYWELYSTSDTLTPLFSGGINGSYSGMSSIGIPICLEDGDYDLLFYDTSNNGMGINGNYRLEGVNGEIYACGGVFTDSESTLFTTGVETADIHEITIEIQLDDWPDETTWQIFDLSGDPTVIISGGPYVNPDDDFTIKSYNFCLASGNYGIAVYDSYGDGGSAYTVFNGTTPLTAFTEVVSSSSSTAFTLN
ncbi:RagB/SusD family nutrient uptake outer membrane protein [Winogradskyella endarachnes]|uniref:RagB/SusD family nutrient uptake outer membrane protein n=1 Tax=Winogradskyella endarachnes TaxID=2681965 RepID=A0A6L6UBK5_9FLAO|nr:RagB/SusD family nutrient uptake outer membrane protein [Winogradskyella endarachnes]MUU79359.1 RagB/SusD family nutrient uptake outer membrane protein [Winogradskyella endarachnes]